MMTAARTRTLALLRKRTMDAELDEEIRVHLEFAERDARQRGLSPEDARRAALRAFGTIEPMKERERDQRSVRWLEFLVADVRYGLRTMSRRVGFTLLVVSILGLGIGSSTAMFSLFDAVLLETLPYPQPERMVRVWETPAPTSRNVTTTLDFLDWKRLATSFDALSVERLTSLTLVREDQPARIHGWSTSADYFRVYGLEAEIGRTFRAGEDQPGAEPVVVLSNSSWSNRFGADPDIVGQELRLNGVTHRVIGVLQSSSFDRHKGELWRPLLFAEDERTRGYHWLPVVGRLTDGTSLEQARDEMTTLDASLAELSPPWKREWGVRVEPFADAHVPADLRQSIPLVFGAVGLVLVIACANVANLLLARSRSRRREFRVRKALGAGTIRLVTQQLTESILLCMAGGLVGIALAHLLLLLASPLWNGMLPATAVVSIDERVLAFAVALAFASGLVVGLFPAYASSFGTAVGPLANRSASRHGERLRRSIVVAEVALSLTLLCGALILARSLLRLQAEDTGIRTSDVLTMSIDLQSRSYTGEDRARSFVRRATEEVAALPNVDAVSFTTDLPLVEVGEGQALLLPGDDGSSTVRFKHIDQHYLRTLEIPVLEGRGVGPEDHADAQSALWINEELAEELRYRGGVERLVGSAVRVSTSDFVGKGGQMLEYRIAGVLRSERVTKPGTVNDSVVYVALEQRPSRGLKVLVRGDNVTSLPASIRELIARVDPNLAIGEMMTLEQLQARTFSDPRRSAVLVGCFAVAAILLFAIGLYGVIAHMTHSKRREISVRIAMGASVHRVIGEVIASGFAMVGMGLVVGAVLAWALVRTASSWIEGIGPLDAKSLIPAAIAVLVIGGVAAWFPARRAAHTDPMAVLREDG